MLRLENFTIFEDLFLPLTKFNRRSNLLNLKRYSRSNRKAMRILIKFNHGHKIGLQKSLNFLSKTFKTSKRNCRPFFEKILSQKIKKCQKWLFFGSHFETRRKNIHNTK